MKTKLFLLIVLTLILSACSPFTIVSSSGEQQAPVEDVEFASTGYQPVTVDKVAVEIGVGSPIPVHAIVSGSLPDVCSQVEHTEIVQDGTNFNISLFATPRMQDCLQDTLPFKMSIPLNVIGLPGGLYSVTVNGARAEFRLDREITGTSLPTGGTPILRDDIQVDSVNIEYGVGSPIPVHAIVSANLPSACAQLGEVRVHRDGTTFFVRLVAYLPDQADCNEDRIPVRLEVPLNIVNLPEGPYTVNANGVTASFDPRTRPAVPAELPAGRTPIQVENVEVQVGVGSPIPVEIVASGTWPDLCAQIAEVQSNVDGFNIDIAVLSSTVDSCPPDHLGLPFRFAIPLNIVEMAEGTYTVTVNGTLTTFDIPVR